MSVISLFLNLTDDISGGLLQPVHNHAVVMSSLSTTCSYIPLGKILVVLLAYPTSLSTTHW